MKNLIFISLSVCLFLCSCKKNEHCFDFKTEKPTDLKPIDPENYNDVLTVYWNYLEYCDEVSRSWQDREFVYNRDNFSYNPNPGDSIKVWGWITGYSLPSSGQFFISNITQGSYKRKSISVFMPIQEGNKLAFKMDSITFPVKCFISGEIILPCLEEGLCRNKVTVSVYVKSADDIYFKN